MKEKLNRFLMRHSQNSIFLWMIVGGYLVYLAWQMLTGELGEANPVLIYIFSAFFIICGGGIVVLSLYSLIGGHYKEKSAPAVSDNSDADEESDDSAAI